MDYGWDDARVGSMNVAERLAYRSNILGNDQRITNTGGGNTSSKAMETDPLTGEEVEILWVKGSGGDLRTSTIENFSSLYQDKLIALQKIYNETSSIIIINGITIRFHVRQPFFFFPGELSKDRD